ncbi:MAG TPA: hypothetical protein VHW91_02650 [Candidatus Dormibacteraeota bacterium]|nr:hypothetical protein [Candidatus Dormibacteraeota bacterium]
MKIWLLAVVIAGGLFAAGSALLKPPPAKLGADPDAIVLTSINAQGATLTQTIHERSVIRQLSGDLKRLASIAPSSCTRSDQGRYLAVFGYPGGGSTTLTAEKGGCQRITISGEGWPADRSWSDPTLLRDFDALFPPSWQTGV